MKKRLIDKIPKRLFTFGCSFTEYKWATWANILGYEFDCEFYNFGKSGAGNTFITNQVTQANNIFNFNKNDLVIINWTNISREDRWSNKKGWVTPGNIYSQQDYDTKFVKLWANDIHFALRDFANIDLTRQYLKNKTNYHFLSMCNVTKHVNQWENSVKNENKELKNIADIYKNALSEIRPSFYDVLWNGNIDYKWKKDWQEIHPHYSDGHPTIKEHFEYLTKTFDYNFSSKTITRVETLHNDWIDYIRKGYAKTKIDCGLHNMPTKWADNIRDEFILREEDQMPSNIWH